MPLLQPLDALVFARAVAAVPQAGDVSALIAPPYDVLDEGPKRALLARDAHNIVAIDLPFTPPKVVGPDAVYTQAGDGFRQWQSGGVLTRRPRPAVYVYEQAYTHGGKSFQRRGLIANVRVQEFGPGPKAGLGGVWAHEQTFASGKEDRLKLMRACQAQLSPIFGIYRDPQHQVGALLEKHTQTAPTFAGRTDNDGVLHRVWEITDPAAIAALTAPVAAADVFIADGHHRYHTALNYSKEVAAQAGGKLPESHPANWCMFVLVAMEDPGMIVLPTHRVLGGMDKFTWAAFTQAAAPYLTLQPFPGDDLAALERALPAAGNHAVGLVTQENGQLHLAIATTKQADPLAATHQNHAQAWRMLDVAVVQHLLVEQICQPNLCAAGQTITWKFPHEPSVLRQMVLEQPGRLGVIVQPTPLSAVMAVSAAGELMPQKSTFFYPKLATGLVLNPLE